MVKQKSRRAERAQVAQSRGRTDPLTDFPVLDMWEVHAGSRSQSGLDRIRVEGTEQSKRGLNRNINNPRRGWEIKGEINYLFPEYMGSVWKKGNGMKYSWVIYRYIFVWILATPKLPRRWEQEGGTRDREKRQNILRRCEAQVLVNHWCDSVKKTLPQLPFPAVTPHSLHRTPCRHSAGLQACRGYSSHLLPRDRRKLQWVCSALAHQAGQDSDQCLG